MEYEMRDALKVQGACKIYTIWYMKYNTIFLEFEGGNISKKYFQLYCLLEGQIVWLNASFHSIGSYLKISIDVWNEICLPQMTVPETN